MSDAFDGAVDPAVALGVEAPSVDRQSCPTQLRPCHPKSYNFPKKSKMSGAVQSTAPINLRRTTPLRSMM